MPLPPHVQEANNLLPQELQDEFVVCFNRKENEEMWESDDPAWIGKASMSKRHVFITTKNISWQRFNVLVYGMFGDREDSLKMLHGMKRCAEAFVKTRDDWSENVGMFLHVYGACSVNSMHLHVIDLDYTGPSYEAIHHRNLSIDDVITAIEKEEE